MQANLYCSMDLAEFFVLFIKGQVNKSPVLLFPR